MVRAVLFSEINVGDRVMITDKWITSESGRFRWNESGLMDHHLGTVMTVREKYRDFLEMVEDQEEFMGGGWNWFPEMIAGLWVDEELDNDTSEWSNDISCGLLM